jgi:hypothetical protein
MRKSLFAKPTVRNPLTAEQQRRLDIRRKLAAQPKGAINRSHYGDVHAGFGEINRKHYVDPHSAAAQLDPRYKTSDFLPRKTRGGPVAVSVPDKQVVGAASAGASSNRLDTKQTNSLEASLAALEAIRENTSSIKGQKVVLVPANLKG